MDWVRPSVRKAEGKFITAVKLKVENASGGEGVDVGRIARTVHPFVSPICSCSSVRSLNLDVMIIFDLGMFTTRYALLLDEHDQTPAPRRREACGLMRPVAKTS